MVQLGGTGSLEARLKATEPRWQSDFCSVQHQPNGAPTLLLVGPSAAGANDLIKQLPAFNKVRGSTAAGRAVTQLAQGGIGTYKPGVTAIPAVPSRIVLDNTDILA